MALISVKFMTNEATGDQEPTGSYEIKILAGLDEEPEVILADALKRIQTALQSIPQEKRFPRLRFREVIF